jgi:hypothetical protein
MCQALIFTERLRVTTRLPIATFSLGHLNTSSEFTSYVRENRPYLRDGAFVRSSRYVYTPH